MAFSIPKFHAYMHQNYITRVMYSWNNVTIFDDPFTAYVVFSDAPDVKCYPANRGAYKLISTVREMRNIKNDGGFICCWVDNYNLCLKNQEREFWIKLPGFLRYNSYDMDAFLNHYLDTNDEKCIIPDVCFCHVNPNDFRVERKYLKKLGGQRSGKHVTSTELNELKSDDDIYVYLTCDEKTTVDLFELMYGVFCVLGLKFENETAYINHLQEMLVKVVGYPGRESYLGEINNIISDLKELRAKYDDGEDLYIRYYESVEDLPRKIRDVCH